MEKLELAPGVPGLLEAMGNVWEGVWGKGRALAGPSGESPWLDSRLGGSCGWEYREAFYRRLDSGSVGRVLHSSSW